jgi:type 1 fimbria pilin
VALTAALTTGAVLFWVDQPAPAGVAPVETITVRGAVLVRSACDDPSSGYSDIRSGGAVKITDASGETVALGELSTGAFQEVAPYGCRYAFVVADVPAGHEFYGVQVGREGRGEMTVSAAEAGAPLELSLGF